MKPVDDIYIYIYIFQHGRLVYTEGHAGGAALGVLEGLLDRRARLARLMRQPSFAHYAMVRARPREISESVPHIRVGLAGLGCLMGHPSFAHHAMARARERDPRFWTHARERGTEIPESGTSESHTHSDVASPSYTSHSYPSHSYPSRTHGPL